MIKKGAKGTSSPADLASKSDVIITMLPDSSIIEEVFLGNMGLAEGLRSGSVAIDMSSASPSSTKKIFHILQGKNINFIDAPVTGGTSGAESGKLTIMVGGEESVFESVRHILAVLGAKLFYMGSIGSGDVMKAVNNYLTAVALVATGEAMILATRAGLSPSRTLEVLNAGSGRNHATETRFPKILKRDFKPGGITISLMHKDVNIATTLGRELKVPMAIANLTEEILCYGIAKGGGDYISNYIVTYFEELMKVEIKG